MKANYEEAYYILMDYWDSLPDEEKPEINKQLKRFSFKMECSNCHNKEGLYIYAILNGINIYDCPKCHKRSKEVKQ